MLRHHNNRIKHPLSSLRKTAARRLLLVEQLSDRFLMAADFVDDQIVASESTVIRAATDSIDKPVWNTLTKTLGPQSIGKPTAPDTVAVDIADEWLFGWNRSFDMLPPNGPALFTTITPSPWIDDALIVEFQQGVSSDDALRHLGVTESPTLAYPLIERQFVKRLIPNDPLFSDQWHLRNTGSFSGSLAGEDAKVTGVWDSYRGSGVVVAIVDDGLQHTHPDLAENYRADLSFDFNGNDNDPLPDPNNGDFHGTAVGGVVAAVQNNSLGVSGAAPEAQLSGIRLIAGGVTDTTEAAALTLHGDSIHVYNNSWGPPDIGTLNPTAQPGPQVLAAFENAAINGRNGLGSIYVWAGGNGGSGDDVNYDMYANSRHTIAVGAITIAGVQAGYSESGAPLLVVTHSNGGSRGITTTDLVGSAGYSSTDYEDSFGGTSSASPLAAGVIALMLDANENLTSRDVQHVLARSARRVDPSDSDWIQNGADLWINHKYGFGAVDAEAAVDLALAWQSVGEELSSDSGVVTFDLAIPDNNPTGVSGNIPIADNFQLEYVELQLETNHADAGDLEVVLISPAGTPSVMARTRSETANFTFSHTFTSTRNWGENSAGDWTLRVIDRASGNTGTLVRAQLKTFGYSLDSPLPNLTVSDPTVNENAGSANFVVTIPEPATDLITFKISTVGSTATENEDYVPQTNQSYQIPVGQSQVTIPVSINDDTIEELAETFRLRFSEVVNADPPTSQVKATINANDDPSDYDATPLSFLAQRALLAMQSTENSVLLNATGDVDDLLIQMPATVPVWATAIPSVGNGIVTIQWLDASGAPVGSSFSSPSPGLPVTTNKYLPPVDGAYGLRIRGDFIGSVEVDFKAGFMIEEATNDSSTDSPMPLTDSLTGFGTFAVLGHSLNRATIHTFDAASKFFDISATGTPFTLSDDGGANITTTVGNAIIPAGSVTIGNNGGIAAGTDQFIHYFPEQLPTQDFTAGILPLWTDLFTGGQVYWDEVVIDGKDALVVQWDNKNHYNVNNGFVTFQLQLFEDNIVPLRLVYTDAEFGNSPSDDFGASAVIGYQASATDYVQFSAFEPSLTNNSVITFVNADEDVYTLDLSNHVGETLDIVLSGVDGVSFANASLELINPAGAVVAVGSANPTGFDATNFDKAITNYAVTAGGVYKVRLANLTASGNYLLSVQPQRQETESNNAISDTLRSLAVDETAMGWLDTAPSGGDSLDHFKITLSTGDRIRLTTSTPMDGSSNMSTNTLNPSLAVLNSSGNVLASDTNSASDGKNASLFFTAPSDGTYILRIEAASGAGVVTLDVVDAPATNHGITAITIGDGTAQRSRIEQVVVTFESDVTIDAGAFEVSKRGTNGGPVDVAFTTALNGNGQTVATLTFSGNQTTSGMLNDGNYQLRVIADKITDASGTVLDGDGDGSAGGDRLFGNVATDAFFRHFGDANGDRSIGFSDFVGFRSTYGSSSTDGNFNEIFDFDDNGSIGFADFVQFRNRFGNTLDFE